MRQDARVTCLTSTLACNVGTFATCARPAAFLAAQNNTFWTTHCRANCQTLTFKGQPTTCMASNRVKPANNYANFLRACAKHKHINFTREQRAGSQAGALPGPGHPG